MALVQIDVPSISKRKQSRFDVIFALGFRPLYLLAALWAVVGVAVWIYAPHLLSSHKMGGMWWHAHEMLWGFIGTVAVAFLLTASATWTGSNPLKSWPLAGLCLLWFIARLSYLVPFDIAFIIGALSDVLFFLGAAFALGRVLLKARSKQNYPLIIALFALGLSHAAYMYMIYEGRFDILRMGFHSGLLVMTFIALMIGRRVIPFFAQRGANLDIPRSEKSGQYQLILVGLALVFLVLGIPVVASILLALLGMLTLYQLYTWKPLGVRKVPLLWVLYISYFLLALGLLEAAVYLFSFDSYRTPPALFVHLIGMGGFSVMIIGMMTLTALGHTGRPLKASRLMVMAYLFVIMATVLRLLVFAFPSATQPLLHSSALLWAIAFISYIYQYTPYLMSPRADGRPG